MKKMVYPSKNSINLTGIIVKDDAFVNNSKSVARFRFAHSTGKNQPCIFIDCVMFAGKDGKSPLPEALLKKGIKLDLAGYLHINAGVAKDGQPAPQPKLEIVVTSLQENTQVEIEVADDGTEQVAVAPTAAVAGEGSLLQLGEDLPEEL